jgi:putative methionine-R-sulfoxide reductase with GAF domain
VKTYRSARELLAQVKRVLAANKPSFHHSPLEDVIELLCRGRHYTWVGIYLAVGKNTPQQLLEAGRDQQPGQVALPETQSKILVSMKLATRELGVLAAESDRENAFGAEDRVLLEQVADVLARFLAGPGKYIARKAREAAAAAPQAEPRPQARAPQSASVVTVRSAAVGEK